MIKTIAIVVVLLLAAVLIFAAFRPDTFRVQRATSIKAPPERIFPLINDFKRWGSWSPYEKKDPNMKRLYGGAAEGQGSTYAWEGDGNVGQGRMEITDASAPGKVAIKLDLTKPLEARVVFTMVPKGEATEVTWDMQGQLPYFAKIVHLFFNMDRMVGTDFEVGLANLKGLAGK
jgi:polyketide cyclase/dehydrase/lipid transport protein